MTVKILVKVIPVLAMLAASGGTALAQNNDDERRDWWPRWGMGQMMNGPFGSGPMMGREPMMGFGWDGMLDRVDGRLAFVKAELGIRDDQSAEWDKFADAVRAHAENRNGLMQSMMDDDYSAKSLPERLGDAESFMEARLEQLKEMRAAVEDLYGVLDDTQKKAANDIMMPAMGMGMGLMMR
ncbi:Spy/CpxP family protein refolding chaperone [uncultured Hoeflea sp.]|uniref:Spy/CpxP family protein refolding chaperone n=1 Tax=uncultured Hoeflea sp. TaxID=538666 RepID=UPI0030DC5299|tara:strand:+ start:5699 stop:6244 length:546 start_codon:yes stop_codon:yes gene_type:complete